ncbi:MAG: LCP family protein [Candidatus Moranbacteria bacterium]|jgi:LCP family protein required for cell wall assembly|nr:LCP family protein [Candidatus Moranbacteria bacterium]MDD5652076.1 LCP family protein [Candidatus Moranbacteria bacterium]MDX9855677.1 LCP family protein [Candidatus Moranbacteria bacterium]
MDGIIRRPKIRKTVPAYGYGPNYSKNPDIRKDFDGSRLFENNPIPDKTEKKKGAFFKKTLVFVISALFLSISATGIYFFWKIGSVSSKIIISNGENPSAFSVISKMAAKDRAELRGENQGRINILLLGIAGEGRAGGSLTDTIMIASIDTKNKKTALLSLPRDLYVEIPESGYNAKINSIYKYGLADNKGVNPLKKTVEKITGLEINYYFVASFAGFEKFIDDIDGIIVNNERDIYDPNYPGPNYSYELFALEKGTHLLDGSTALKYARERHNDPEGDFGRAKRQQQVMQAIKNRIFSTKVLLNPFAINDILNTLGENIKTDISLEEMESFLKLSRELDTQNINNVVVDAWKKDSLLKVSHIYHENMRAFILVPRVGNYSEIQELAQNIFNLNEVERRREEIEKEEVNIAIINQSGSPELLEKINSLIKDKLKIKNIGILQGDRTKLVSSTQIIDMTNGQVPFTLDELIKKLPATLNEKYSLSENETEGFDLVILLGTDLIGPYSFEENSMKEMEDDRNDFDNKELLVPNNR